METQEIEKVLEEALGLSEVHVKSDGSHFQIIVVGDIFSGVSRVKKQQMVYAPLSDKIADGSMHAVSIKAFSKDEWEKYRKLNPPQ